MCLILLLKSIKRIRGVLLVVDTNQHHPPFIRPNLFAVEANVPVRRHLRSALLVITIPHPKPQILLVLLAYQTPLTCPTGCLDFDHEIELANSNTRRLNADACVKCGICPLPAKVKLSASGRAATILGKDAGARVISRLPHITRVRCETLDSWGVRSRTVWGIFRINGVVRLKS